MKSLGFNILGDEHPIAPVMLGDANVAQRMSKELLNNGIYAVGFSFPVVPKGMARIRLQINSEHTVEELDKAIKIFKKVREKFKSHMKALVKEKAEIGLHLKDVEVPKVGDNDVLIKSKIDCHLWDRLAHMELGLLGKQSDKTSSLTLGHEFMGTIHKVGTNVDRFRIGERVSVESHIVGNRSRNARAGRLHLESDTINLVLIEMELLLNLYVFLNLILFHCLMRLMIQLDQFLIHLEVQFMLLYLLIWLVRYC